MEKKNINLILFALIHSSIKDVLLTVEEKNSFYSDMIPELFKISRNHDVSHIVADGLFKNKLIQNDDEYYSYFQADMLAAVYRYGQNSYTYANLCNLLEEEGIDFVPLKGSVIRKLYNEPWMRTSCDIDILILKRDLDKTVSILTEKYGYKNHRINGHDASIFAPNGVHVELHFSLIEEHFAKSSAEILENVWNSVVLKNGYNHCYEMTDEMFYFYHISHMAKHIEFGGCGIKPFIDTYILDNLNGIDFSKRDALLKKGNLLKFANCVRNVSRVWFEGTVPDITSDMLQQYVLDGGVYGSLKNQVAIWIEKRGGKKQYIISKIFVPYNELKLQYPILNQNKLLYPVMLVKKWFVLFKPSRFNRSVETFNISKNISDSKENKIRIFLKNIGL